MMLDKSPHRAADDQSLSQALHNAADTAGYAPSIHNTQPWQWRLHDDCLDLFVDRERTLVLTDPTSRLAFLSCGAALNHALISLAAEGWHATVTRLPEPSHPGHLATVRADRRMPIEPSALRQVRAVASRHTDRQPISSAHLDTDKLRSLVTAAQSGGSSLQVLRPRQVFALARAADNARHTENGTTAWQAELQYWTGGARPLHTGLPEAVIPYTLNPTRTPGRDFGLTSDLLIAESRNRTTILAILSRPGDEPLDWLRAGEALSAVWLTATMLHVAVLPLSVTVEVPGTRERIRHLLTDAGYPMLVLRFSALNPDAAAAPHTPRLRDDQTILRKN